MSFVAPVVGALENPESERVALPVERKIPEEHVKVDFSSMQKLKETAPEVYTKIFEGLATQSVIQMDREEKRRQARAKEAKIGG